MFKEFDLDNLNEGMILAKPVLNKIGQVMIAQNVALTSRHINILKMWGITQVTILISDSNTESQDALISIDKIKQELQDQLGWQIDHPFIDEIIELAALSKYRVS